jgi:hypothetical protein
MTGGFVSVAYVLNKVVETTLLCEEAAHQSIFWTRRRRWKWGRFRAEHRLAGGKIEQCHTTMAARLV